MGHPETSEIEALQFQICHAPKPAHSTTGGSGLLGFDQSWRGTECGKCQQESNTDFT